MGQLPFCQGVRLLRIKNCFARSSPNKRFDVVVALFAHLVWNSGRKEGFSCSHLKADSSDTTCPTRAMASMLSVSISLVSTLDFKASQNMPTDSKASTAMISLACVRFSCNSVVTRTDVEVESIFSRLGKCWERSRCKDVYFGAPPFSVLFFAIRCLQKGKIDPNLLPRMPFRPRKKKVKKPIVLRAQAKERTRY